MQQFFVTAKTFAFVQCPDCTAGFVKRTFRGVTTKVVCSTCNGTMRKKITHTTEVPLEEALKEINNRKNNEQ